MDWDGELDYSSLPANVQAIVDIYDYNNDPYEESALLNSRLREIGWGAEYGLDGEAIIFKVK